MKKIYTIIFAMLSILPAMAQETVETEITEANWATFWLQKGIDFTANDNVRAYMVSAVNETTVTLSVVEKAAAGDVVILWGVNGTHTFTVDENATPLTGNLLKASAEPVVSNGNHYGLKYVNGVIGFYRTTAGYEVPAGKGYLVIGGNNEAVYTLEFDDAGIETVTLPQGDGKYYNLQGMEVVHPTHGLYIHNGKKVLVK